MRLAAATDVDVRVTVSHGAPSQLAVSQCVCRVAYGASVRRGGRCVPSGRANLTVLLEDLPLLRLNTIVLLNAGRARPRHMMTLSMQRKMARCMPSCWRCVVLRCLLRYQLLYG
jgi:hypothetical protein